MLDSYHWGVVGVLLATLLGSLVLGNLAQRVVERGSFLKGFFLGNRNLGSWALALTATVQSGGTFLGFPSFVYAHGWTMAFWIAGYMVVPMMAFGVLAKRLAQLSRRTGAITVPDLFRERFASPALGLTTSLLIIFYMSFMLVAQFKGGALIMQIAWEGIDFSKFADSLPVQADPSFLAGLFLFSGVVIVYTLLGGFLAAVWTDLLQSILMLIGVLLLLPLALRLAGGLEIATRTALANTGPGFALCPGHSTDGRAFLPLGLGFSFFFTWVFAGVGSPAAMGRLMASRDSLTIRRSIALFSSYNLCIYIPLILICVAARAVIPDLPAGKTDEIIPRLAIKVTQEIFGGPLIAGLILAAPFGAVMATISSYLVVIASGMVRDVYARFIRPHAADRELLWVSRLVILLVGAGGVIANLRPPAYLQAIVVFNNTSQAATFVIPCLMLAFWRRATAVGTLAAMLGGAGTTLSLFIAGWILAYHGYDQFIGPQTAFRPYYLWGIDPIVWGMLASLILGIVVTLRSTPPAATRLSSRNVI